MRILWVTPNFLHPTTKGGQIRTLEMLRRLSRRHEIHYVAVEHEGEPEGPARSSEYAAHAYPFRLRIPPRGSLAFYAQLATGLWSPLPLAVKRFVAPEIRTFLESLLARENFDRAVCDFLVPSAHFPRLESAVLFQHNVETLIWRRHAERASTLAHRLYFRLQARRMFDYERRITRQCGHVVAVSEADARTMREMFGVTRVSAIPTGVDVDYFRPPAESRHTADLVFLGSMDWLPNIDGMLWFVNEIFPLILRERPECTLAIVGRSPAPEILRLARNQPNITVSGTVPDVRPYIWGSTVSIVPLRIGGGTRLKIYETAAAGVPVVSTTIGAEGLSLSAPQEIRLADTPETFAQACLGLLANTAERERLRDTALNRVRDSFSWETVVDRFEEILAEAPRFSVPFSGATRP